MNTPETICQEADRITSTDRQDDYGHPIHNLTRTARIWEVVLNLPTGSITPEQVGLCMIGTKLARESFKHKRDNLTDCAGYGNVVQAIYDYRAREVASNP